MSVLTKYDFQYCGKVRPKHIKISHSDCINSKQDFFEPLKDNNIPTV